MILTRWAPTSYKSSYNPYRVFFTPVKTQLFSVIYRGYPYIPQKLTIPTLQGLFDVILRIQNPGIPFPPWKQGVDLYNYHCWTLRVLIIEIGEKTVFLMVVEAQGKGSFFFSLLI